MTTLCSFWTRWNTLDILVREFTVHLLFISENMQVCLEGTVNLIQTIIQNQTRQAFSQI